MDALGKAASTGRTKARRVVQGVVALMVLLAAGAVLTVCTTWCIAPRIPIAPYIHTLDATMSDVPSRLRSSWPAPFQKVVSSNSAGTGEVWTVYASVSGNPGDAEGMRVAILWRYRYGWPVHALERMDFLPFSGNNLALLEDAYVAAYPNHGAIRIPESIASWATPGMILLPTTIIWPGFTISTIGWACISAILWYSPRFIRSAWRRRHGRCIACGYALHALAICPECGRTR
jgi:hypothetical protein